MLSIRLGIPDPSSQQHGEDSWALIRDDGTWIKPKPEDEDETGDEQRGELRNFIAYSPSAQHYVDVYKTDKGLWSVADTIRRDKTDPLYKLHNKTLTELKTQMQQNGFQPTHLHVKTE